MENPGRLRAIDFIFGLAGVLLLGLLVHMIASSPRVIGRCDLEYFYLASWAWLHGISPYAHLAQNLALPGMNLTGDVLARNPYPPLCAMIFSPFALLPAPVALGILLYGEFAILLAGIWRFSTVILPALTTPHRLFLIGLTALAGPFNWLLYLQQPSTLFIGLLLLFGAEVLSRRWITSWLLAVIVGIKMTFFLPVVGLYLWNKKVGMLAGVVAAIIALNLAACAHTGLSNTLHSYASVTHSVTSSYNRPNAYGYMVPGVSRSPESPLHPLLKKMGEFDCYQIQYSFMFSAWTLSDSLATVFAWTASLMSLVGIVVIVRKRWCSGLSDATYESLLFSILCTLSLLIIYHGRYDLMVLVAGVLSSLCVLRHNPQSPAALVAFLLGGFLSYGIRFFMINMVIDRLVIPYGWIILLPFPTYVLIGLFVAQLALLARYELPEKLSNSGKIALEEVYGRI